MAAPVILDLTGLSLTHEEQEILQHPQVGGVILFSRNYEEPEQLELLVQQIRAQNQEILICVDQEGGRVQRFIKGFTRLPPLKSLGDLYTRDASKSLEAARELGWLMASELRVFDIDLSFAPVLDLDLALSEVIGDRAFHQYPEVVAQLGSAYCTGIREAGMPAVGKHFPGHGSVTPDSHHQLPYDDRSIEQIREQDLIPFEKLIQEDIEGLMAAHIVYPQIDGLPVGFSRIWLQQILRNQMGFEGVIFSDDLTMAGAASLVPDFVDRAWIALKSGCDYILVCQQQRVQACRILEYLESKNYKMTRFLKIPMRPSRATWRSLIQSDRWQYAVNFLEL